MFVFQNCRLCVHTQAKNVWYALKLLSITLGNSNDKSDISESVLTAGATKTISVLGTGAKRKTF